MKESINDTPKSAMAFYVKIYCQKLNKTKNRQYNLMEATKSWVSLSEADKQYFVRVFKEYKTKTKIQFASNLQKVQLYMKKQRDQCKRPLASKTTITDHNLPTYEDSKIGDADSFSICSYKERHNPEDIQHSNEKLENYFNTSSAALENLPCGSTASDVPRLISEPTPPIRSSMELFEMIKHNEEFTKNNSWTDLTKLQKQRYQRALLSIKSDYIKQYIAYLEQLTPDQLLNYYRSKSFELDSI